MVGPVDFHKNFEYWQQDKWNGCFPVKWHIVKDVPNSLLKHITLENNENKPVTNSRDTQEVCVFLVALFYLFVVLFLFFNPKFHAICVGQIGAGASDAQNI